MTKVLILGANGGIAGYAIDLFLKETDAELTLFLRNAGNPRKLDPYRTRVIEGDVMDMETLKKQWQAKTLSMPI